MRERIADLIFYASLIPAAFFAAKGVIFLYEWMTNVGELSAAALILAVFCLGAALLVGLIGFVFRWLMKS